MRFEYNNDGHYLNCAHPVLPNNLYELRATVNWSPPFQALPVKLDTLELDKAYYRALANFEQETNRRSARYAFDLEEGDLVLFDNSRVLHARTAFRDWTPEEVAEKGIEIVPGEPTRWLKGCYLDGEVVWDKLVALMDQERRRRHIGYPGLAWSQAP